MLKNFLKYQSLGNDFILLDWYKKPETYVAKTLSEATLQPAIASMCERNFGIGADGVLILKGNTSAGIPEMLIFNKDGSQAEMCLNGLRCVAQHLFFNYKTETSFKIKVGPRVIECTVQNSKDNINQVVVKNNVGKIEYSGIKSIKTTQGDISGHVASIGNPHLIVFQEKSLDWLKNHGSEIETHKEFPQKTNVEFVWQSKTSSTQKIFNSIVFERGCGITLACGSGVACIAGVLLKLDLVSKNENFQVSMPGGIITCSVDNAENITLSAAANFVFSGTTVR